MDGNLLTAIRNAGQEQVLRFYDELTVDAQQAFETQLETPGNGDPC